MRGGVRKGSGRKNLSNADRKKAKNIYLSDKQIENIEKMSLVGCSSFSQKCSELISLGIATINKNEEKRNILIFDAVLEYQSIRMKKKILRK